MMNLTPRLIAVIPVSCRRFSQTELRGALCAVPPAAVPRQRAPAHSAVSFLGPASEPEAWTLLHRAEAAR